MDALPNTHIIYVENLVNGKKERKLMLRLRSKTAALNMLNLILDEEGDNDAYKFRDEVRIVKDKHVIKKWIVADIEKEKELNFNGSGFTPIKTHDSS